MRFDLISLRASCAAWCDEASLLVDLKSEIAARQNRIAWFDQSETVAQAEAWDFPTIPVDRFDETRSYQSNRWFSAF